MWNRPYRHVSGLARRHQAGLTLIEVLVAVLILSIGLLGLAGLQATSLRTNHSAYLRSQATILSQAMLDELRANRSASLKGTYNIELDQSPGDTGAPDAIAERLRHWREQLGEALPSSKGAVNVAANGMTTVTVQWDERGAEGMEAMEFELSGRL